MFARFICAFNVGDGGSIECFDDGGSFFGEPISYGSPDSFQRVLRDIFLKALCAWEGGIISESDKD